MVLLGRVMVLLRLVSYCIVLFYCAYNRNVKVRPRIVLF